MQLNDATDYSLRVLLYAASRADARCTAEEVATAFGISRHHVVKVVHGLGRLGYLTTHRGRSGGFTLAQPAARIRIGDIVRKTESTLDVVECFAPASNACPLATACGLQDALGEAMGAFLAVLDRYSLADLLAQPRWAARVAAVAAG
jgi:Rrf2 family nitric oxide-sensitive transcriptional repressor